MAGKVLRHSDGRNRAFLNACLFEPRTDVRGLMGFEMGPESESETIGPLFHSANVA
jgi:hypothetical protein